MLWDMVRYENFDVSSPYNREAAIWARSQFSYDLPVDVRPLRDRHRRETLADPVIDAEPVQRDMWFIEPQPRRAAPPSHNEPIEITAAEIVDDEIIEAEVVGDNEQDIVFID